MHTSCKFQYTEEKGFLKCINCGRIKRSNSSPELCYAYCKINYSGARRIIKDCGCNKR